jgi:hypothetical protein
MSGFTDITGVIKLRRMNTIWTFRLTDNAIIFLCTFQTGMAYTYSISYVSNKWTILIFLWVVTPRLVEAQQWLGRTGCFHLKGRRVYPEDSSSIFSETLLSTYQTALHHNPENQTLNNQVTDKQFTLVNFPPLPGTHKDHRVKSNNEHRGQISSTPAS